MTSPARQLALEVAPRDRCPRCGRDLARVVNGPWLLLRALQRLDEAEWRRALACWCGTCSETTR